MLLQHLSAIISSHVSQPFLQRAPPPLPGDCLFIKFRLKVHLANSKPPAMGHPLNFQTSHSRLCRQPYHRLNPSRRPRFSSSARCTYSCYQICPTGDTRPDEIGPGSSRMYPSTNISPTRLYAYSCLHCSNQLQNRADPNLSLCPSGHPFIDSAALEVEGSTLLMQTMASLYTSSYVKCLFTNNAVGLH